MFSPYQKMFDCYYSKSERYIFKLLQFFYYASDFHHQGIVLML